MLNTCAVKTNWGHNYTFPNQLLWSPQLFFKCKRQTHTKKHYMNSYCSCFWISVLYYFYFPQLSLLFYCIFQRKWIVLLQYISQKHLCYSFSIKVEEVWYQQMIVCLFVSIASNVWLKTVRSWIIGLVRVQTGALKLWYISLSTLRQQYQTEQLWLR